MDQISLLVNSQCIDEPGKLVRSLKSSWASVALKTKNVGREGKFGGTKRMDT